MCFLFHHPPCLLCLSSCQDWCCWLQWWITRVYAAFVVFDPAVHSSILKCCLKNWDSGYIAAWTKSGMAFFLGGRENRYSFDTGPACVQFRARHDIWNQPHCSEEWIRGMLQKRLLLTKRLYNSPWGIKQNYREPRSREFSNGLSQDILSNIDLLSVSFW